MKGRKTGRTKGTPNKRTVERQLHRRAQAERLEQVHGELARAIESGKVADSALMREVVAILGEQLGVASAKAPRPIERTATPLDALLETMYVLLDKWKHPLPGQKPEETIKAAQLLVDVAAKAAPYVHPRLEAVAHADVTPKTPQMSMLDMARRIEFILTAGTAEQPEQQALALIPATGPGAAQRLARNRMRGFASKISRAGGQARKIADPTTMPVAIASRSR